MKAVVPQNKLAARFAEKAAMTPEDAERFISEFFHLTAEALEDSGDVNVKGFGRFVYEEDQVKFIPAPAVAAIVNEPFSFFEPVELKEDITEEILNGAVDQTPDTDKSESRDKEEEVTAIIHEDINEGSSKSEFTGPDNHSDDEIAEREIQAPHPSSAPEPVIIYEPVYQTRPWPVILGLILGLAIGVAIGFVIARTHPEFLSSSQAVEASETVIYNDNESLITADTLTSASPETEIDIKQIDSTTDSIKQIELPVAQEPAMRYDTVTPHRFLATMAREHYGIMEYWIFIYEENRSTLPANPNRITPGTRVIIPPVEKYVPSGDRAEGRAKAVAMISQLEKNL